MHMRYKKIEVFVNRCIEETNVKTGIYSVVKNVKVDFHVLVINSR